MEVRTVTAEKSITLRDIDVNLLGGDMYPLTVQPEDDLTIAGDGRIELRVAKTGEQIVVLAQHVRWYSVRERTIKVPDTAGGSK